MKNSTPRPRRQPKEPPNPLTWSQLRRLLNRPIAYHRVFATIGGGAKAGLFLSQGFYWTNIKDEGDPEAQGWFYKTQVQWEFETGLTRDEQETARRQLVKRGLLKEKRQGLPAKLHFQIQKEKVLSALWAVLNGDSEELSQSSMRESPKLGRGKPANKSGPKPQALEITEITSRSTPNTSSSSPSDVDADDESFLIRDLIALGVTPNRAKKLSPANAPELRRRIEFLPHLKNIENPAALICSHLDEPWNEPPALSKRRAAEIAEVQAAADARAAAIRRAAEDQRQTEMRDLEDRLDAHYKNLDEIDRAEIDVSARQHLTRVMGETRATPVALARARRQVIAKELGFPMEDETDEAQ
jgi:hypothetical protein